MSFPPPPCFTICRAAAWLTRNEPNRLTSITLFHSSSVTSRNGFLISMPALLTAMSSRPNFATISATIRSTSARLLTSPGHRDRLGGEGGDLGRASSLAAGLPR